MSVLQLRNYGGSLSRTTCSEVGDAQRIDTEAQPTPAPPSRAKSISRRGAGLAADRRDPESGRRRAAAGKRAAAAGRRGAYGDRGREVDGFDRHALIEGAIADLGDVSGDVEDPAVGAREA